MKTHFLPFLFALAMFINHAGLNGQTVVHTSHFSDSQGETYTTTGAIGTSPWLVSRSGDDWGARIHNDRMELTNTASTATNADGWVFVHLTAGELGLPYQTTLANNTDKVYWYFNMRQIRSNPAGFGTNNYGAAFVVAATQAQVGTQGSGYAIVLGNSGTPDPIRFVKFGEGLQSIGSANQGLIIAAAPLNDPTNNYMSLLLTWDPSTDTWELYGRNDGATGFSDPQTGELTLLGSATDNTHTGLSTPFTGAYWQGSTAANQTAFFDNISILSDASGAIPPSITQILQTPADDITPETTVSVSATVTPGDAALAQVQLNWGTEAGALTHTIAMIAGENNVFTTNTDIPAQPHNTTVYYVVHAQDQDGETATSAQQSYQVIDPEAEIAIISISPIGNLVVEQFTPFEDLELPVVIEVTLENLETAALEIQWNQGDYNPDELGVYTILGDLVLTGNIINPSNLQAQVQVTVVETIIILTIVAVEGFEPIQAEVGTAFADLQLPAQAQVALSDDSTIELQIYWSDNGYNADLPGTYTLAGVLLLQEGIENPDNLQASIEVTLFEPVLPELLAGWTFPGETQGADQGVETNIGKLISRDSSFGGNYSWPSGASPGSFAISSTGWSEGVATKYWIIELSTVGYGDLTLSSKQQSSNTGPAHFKVQYRIGNTGTWVDIPNSEVTVANNFVSGVLSQVDLPAACNNKPFLFLRWVMTSNTAVNGNPVAPAGTSRIDDIFIKGIFSDDFKRIVTGIEDLAPLQVEIGTQFNELDLPATVEVTFDDTGIEMLPVTWIEGDYDGNTLGSYTLLGNIQITEAMENPDNLQAQIQVTVIPEIQYFTVTFNVDMSQANFDPATDVVYITGSMFGNAIPGTLPEQQLMQEAGNGIYTKTMTLQEGSYTYKYYINEGIGYPEAGPDRVLQLDQDKVVNDVWLSTQIVEPMPVSVQVFPNPASTHLNVVADQNIIGIRLLDLQGKEILSYNLTATQARVELPTLSAGIYLLHITSERSSMIRKITIQP